MAEEEKEAPVEEASEEVEETKKGSLKKLIVIGGIVLILGGGGFAGWKFFLAEKFGFGQSEDQQSEEVVEESTVPGLIHKMEPFIVNLLDQGGKRYLKAQFSIEVESEEIKQELHNRTPQLRDAILLLLASKSFLQIGVPEGKIQLRTELIERINSVLKTSAVRTLYFTEFVVQ